MNALIFAAGLGTRLKPLTDTMPKAMVPINGKPLVQILIVWIGSMRISIYDRLSAGFQVSKLWSMYKQSPKGIFAYLIMLGAFAVTAFLPVNVVFVILFCAAAGIVQALIVGRRGKQ